MATNVVGVGNPNVEVNSRAVIIHYINSVGDLDALAMTVAQATALYISLKNELEGG